MSIDFKINHSHITFIKQTIQSSKIKMRIRFTIQNIFSNFQRFSANASNILRKVPNITRIDFIKANSYKIASITQIIQIISCFFISKVLSCIKIILKN